MGLSSSQARLLTLTSRQHSVEHQAQLLMNNKMRLANDSDNAYTKYLNALNSTSLKTLQTDENGKEGWIAGNIYNLMRYETAEYTSGTVFYTQDINTGKLYIPKTLGNNYDLSSNEYEFAMRMGITYKTVDVTENVVTDPASFESNPFLEYIPNNYKMAKYYEEMYKSIKAAGGWIEVSDTLGRNYDWVNNMIKNAQVCLTTWDANSEMLSKTSPSLQVNLKEVTDNTSLEKASQEYEDTTALINQKDAAYDKTLSKLESERNALTTEIESLQGIISNNIEKNFKLYS